MAAALAISDGAARKAVMEMENGAEFIVVTNAMIRECSDVTSSNIRKLNNRGETFLTESGLYEMIMQSRKPEAKMFRRWVTREVLPALRKNGYYGSAPVAPQLPGDYLSALKALVASEEEKAALLESNAQKDKQLMIAAPKAEAFEAIGEASGSILIGRAAALMGSHKIGLGRNNLFRYLRQHKIIKANDAPYAQYAHHFDVVEGTPYAARMMVI